jgi:hypothetical protein
MPQPFLQAPSGGPQSSAGLPTQDIQQAVATGQIPPGLLAVLMGLLQGGSPVGGLQQGPGPLAGLPAQQAAAGQASPSRVSQINPAVRQNLNPTLQGLAGPTV